MRKVRRVHEAPMAVERRQLMLGGAAVLALSLAAWTLWPSNAPAPTSSAARRQARGAAAEQVAVGPVGPVKLGALTAERAEPGDAPRNPFRFQPKAPPPAPPRPAPAVVDAPPRPVISAPPGPPPAPPIPLKFLGVVERANGVKWAVLGDGKSAPMYGKDGDIIDGKYLIVKIGVESIEMTYTDGRGRQVIRLTGQ